MKSKLDLDLEDDLFSDEDIAPKKNISKPKKPKLDDDFNDFDDDFNDLDDDFGDSDFGGSFSSEGQITLEKHGDLLKELTSFSPYLKTTVNNWLGITWDDTQKKYVRNEQIEPIMNIKGVTWCIGRLGTYTRGNNIITNITAADYKAIIMDFIKEIWFNIVTKKEKFGIKDNGDVYRICNELQHAAELVLMGAGGGKYNQFLGSTTSYSIQGKAESNQPIQKPKSSKLKRLFGL